MSGRPSGRATTRDVARLAGVSAATVSRALNGRPEVQEETRRRVRDAAEQLNFSFSVRGARPRERELTVGILTSDSVGRFSIPVMLGAQDALGTTGRAAAFLCDARGDAIREQHYVEVLVDRKVDGIIVVGERTDPREPLVVPSGLPVVYAYAPSSDPGDISYVADNVQGAELAVDHLLSLGRSRVGCIAGPQHYAATHDRLAGMRRALDRAALDIAGDVVFVGDWSARWGRLGAATLLSRQPETDAIFCGNDQIASGVIDTLRDAGRSVPGDVAVIGFDNWEVVASDAQTPLTTVDMNLDALGRAAAKRLFSTTDSDEPRGVHPLPCRLIIRQSTAS